MSNLTPDNIRRINVGLSEFLQKELRSEPGTVRLCNTAEELPDGNHKWRLSVTSSRPLSKVIFYLHPTFKPHIVEVKEPFSIERIGWGTFVVKIECHFTYGDPRILHHELSFSKKETYHTLSAVDEMVLEKNHLSQQHEIKCMDTITEASMHGRNGVGKGWQPPIIVHECNQRSRPKYNSALAHEYQEEKSTLRAKIAHLAQLLRSAKYCVAYTGAGISTASGIDDYASKGHRSLATGDGVTGTYRPKARKGLDAEPSFSHYCLSALQSYGMVQSWVQQNHDGLPQKAGFPQCRINEIHGAWFDPSNPVVPMDGSLRDDLFQRILEDEKKADLVIAIGTSLCGMNADRIVSTPAHRYCEMGTGLGSVIIGFQRTPLDDTCSLRIFARIDEVMLLLARELGLTIDLIPYSFFDSHAAKSSGERFVFTVPYSKDGTKSLLSTLQLDLRVGAKIKLTGGPGKGYIGTVVGTPNEKSPWSWCVKLPCTRENSVEQGKVHCLYALGGWMVDAAIRGELKMLPIVNV